MPVPAAPLCASIATAIAMPAVCSPAVFASATAMPLPPEYAAVPHAPLSWVEAAQGDAAAAVAAAAAAAAAGSSCVQVRHRPPCLYPHTGFPFPPPTSRLISAGLNLPPPPPKPVWAQILLSACAPYYGLVWASAGWKQLFNDTPRAGTGCNPVC